MIQEHYSACPLAKGATMPWTTGEEQAMFIALQNIRNPRGESVKRLPCSYCGELVRTTDWPPFACKRCTCTCDELKAEGLAV